MGDKQFTPIEIEGDSVTQDDVMEAISAISYQKMGRKMMICHLTLRDGHEVIGQAGIVNPDNFDEEIGQGIALGDATNKVWSHMGSILQDRLSREFWASLKVDVEE